MFISPDYIHCTQDRQTPNQPVRRGVALVVVMMVLTMSLAVVYSLSATQSTLLMTSNNSLRKDLALQAAQTGAAAALEEMQSADWSGITQVLARTLTSDSAGTSSYNVIYQTISNSELTAGSEDAHLHLKIVSTGNWTSASDATHQTDQQVEVLVRLVPRLPEDHIGADDLTANPGDYDAIQQYTLFAESGGNSLIIEPGERVDGNLWLKNTLQLFHDPRWNQSVYDDFLESLGRKYGTTTPAATPHPLAGDITYYNSPSSSETQELAKLNVAWSQTNQQLHLPSVNYSAWTSYQLYAGGPVYQAQPVAQYFDNVTLRPSESNPLGIFYRNGTIWIGNNVTIQGTLISTGTISIYGDDVQIMSYDGTDSQHQSLISATWPRLPAVVAHRLFIDRDMQCVIEGAIIATDYVKGAGSDFKYLSVSEFNLSTTATCQPIRQPWSLVQLPAGVDISSLTGNSDYAIWFPDVQSGAWYAIEDVDTTNRKLKIIGEVTHDTATACVIGKNRKHYADLRGPVAAEDYDFYRPDVWADPSSSEWNDLHTAWQADNTAAVEAAQQAAGEGETVDPIQIEFADWLATPGNWNQFNWSTSYQETYGLDANDIVLQLSRPGNHQYRWSPPLFTAYPGATQTDTDAGYRWQVVSWRQLP